MKLLLDQGIPRSAAALLREAGIDTVHVGEIGHSRSDDNVILQLARDSDRTVATLDADFHTLLALSGESMPSVIRVRIEKLRADAMSKLLQAVIEQCKDDLAKGAAVIVQESRIRIRHLPITSE
jgi:predicted nuclease of predicted toxin-antitoxin system